MPGVSAKEEFAPPQMDPGKLTMRTPWYDALLLAPVVLPNVVEHVAMAESAVELDNAYIPNCIESGERATAKVLGEWGIVLAEDQAEEKRYY